MRAKLCPNPTLRKQVFKYVFYLEYMRRNIPSLSARASIFSGLIASQNILVPGLFEQFGRVVITSKQTPPRDLELMTRIYYSSHAVA
jgi:hypothetical protein